MIKTAILCIPTYDEQASAAVRRLLHDSAPGCTVLLEQNAPMQRYVVEDLLRRWSDDEEMDLVLTIGGTLPAPGPSGREVVPEATITVAERQLPGISEAMRAHAAAQTPLAWLDRGVSVIRGRTVLINLPAGTAAAFFLERVVVVIPAVVAHLQEAKDAPLLEVPLRGEGTSELPSSPDATTGSEGGKKSLDPAEFAAYLQRKRGAE